MIEVKLNKSNSNPFYGLRNCLALQQKATGSITTSLLDACWEEVKDNLEKKQMFFSVLFSIGDITARHHNIFGNINAHLFFVKIKLCGRLFPFGKKRIIIPIFQYLSWRTIKKTH